MEEEHRRGCDEWGGLGEKEKEEEEEKVEVGEAEGDKDVFLMCEV